MQLLHVMLQHRRVNGSPEPVSLPGQTQENILRQRVAVQPGHLRGIGAARRHKEVARVLYGTAIPEYLAAVRWKQAQQRADQSGFAGADASGDNGEGALLQRKVNIPDAPPGSGVQIGQALHPQLVQPYARAGEGGSSGVNGQSLRRQLSRLGKLSPQI
ncbi:hypothetical protein D3C76_974860 [compost metagenome]